MITLIPNYIRNVDEILAHVDRHQKFFYPREGADAHESLIPGICSKFKTLKSCDMDDDLIEAIFRDSQFPEHLKDFYEFIQIQKYEPGDYIAPHRDAYHIRKLHLITLTSSSIDGLVCEDGDILVKIPDVAGQYIDFPYDACHYVSPVNHLRYSIVIAE